MTTKKTPISYYGGKQGMLRHILPLIPKHKIYTEAFFGGGAVFFAKEPAESETINDISSLAVVFYTMTKLRFIELKSKIEATLFSRATYSVAHAMYRIPHLFGDLQLAWAFYISCNMSFNNNVGSWGYDKYGKRLKAFMNKKMSFDESIVKRLERTHIENNDAIKVIRSRDTPESFHYIDPPYIDSDQGMYKGYSHSDYIRLLETLSDVKGKFLLSSYPSDILAEYTEKNGWYSKTFEKPLSASKTSGTKRKRKIEVLTASYPI